MSSIAQQIAAKLQDINSEIGTALASKGVVVSANAKLSGVAALIHTIKSCSAYTELTKNAKLLGGSLTDRRLGTPFSSPVINFAQTDTGYSYKAQIELPDCGPWLVFLADTNGYSVMYCGYSNATEYKSKPMAMRTKSIQENSMEVDIANGATNNLILRICGYTTNPTPPTAFGYYVRLEDPDNTSQVATQAESETEETADE